MACDPTTLSAYLDEELPVERRRQLGSHLEHCPECARELVRLERTRTVLATLLEEPGIHETLMRRAAEEVPTFPLWRRAASHPATLAAIAVMLLAVATWFLGTGREETVEVASVAATETTLESTAAPSLETPEPTQTERSAQAKRTRGTARLNALPASRSARPSARARRQIAAHKAEVESMAAVLGQYYKEHGRTYPETLSALSAQHPDLFADTENRSITYDSQRKRQDMWRQTREIPSFEELSRPDQLMAREQALEEVFGDYFLNPPPLLSVTYAEPTVTVEVGYNRKASIREASDAPRDTSEEAQQAMRTACANNMKQLGIVIRMFENETDDYTPPGWHYVHPEYLNDLRILTCPNDEPGTMSYEILFPATHRDYLEEVVSGVTGVPIENLGRNWRSLLPIMVESHDHLPSQPGREVAFADGHVSFVPADELDNLLAPYLNYR